MRKWTIVAIAILTQAAGGSLVQAAEPLPPGPTQAQPYYAAESPDDCNGGRSRRCLACLHNHIEGKDLGYSCGAQGSYKFPVPPLYTYHWPGMYSAPLMTDYHSPWRFPPLKPYTEASKNVRSKTTGNSAQLPRSNF